MALLLQLDASPNVVNVDNDEDLHQESESDSETVSGSDAASDVVDDDSSAPSFVNYQKFDFETSQLRRHQRHARTIYRLESTAYLPTIYYIDIYIA